MPDAVPTPTPAAKAPTFADLAAKIDVAAIKALEKQLDAVYAAFVADKTEIPTRDRARVALGRAQAGFVQALQGLDAFNTLSKTGGAS